MLRLNGFQTTECWTSLVPRPQQDPQYHTEGLGMRLWLDKRLLLKLLHLVVLFEHNVFLCGLMVLSHPPQVVESWTGDWELV